MASSTKSLHTANKTHYRLFMRLTRVGPKQAWPYKPTKESVFCSKTIDPGLFQSETFEMAQRLFQKIGKVVKKKKVKSELTKIVS